MNVPSFAKLFENSIVRRNATRKAELKSVETAVSLRTATLTVQPQYIRSRLVARVLIALASFVFTACSSAPGTPASIPTTVLPSTSTLPASPTTSTKSDARITVDVGSIESNALKGNRLGDPSKRPLAVLLPPGYANSNKRYPVVYHLHGRGPTTTSGYPDANVKAALEQGVLRGDLQDMIIVFPNSSNKLALSVYRGSPAVGDIETYLAKEVVDYVDSHYRTLAQRESRGVAGCSMGGDGSLHMALSRPEVYGVAVPMAGLYYWDRLPPITEGGPEGYTAEPTTIQEFQKLPMWTTQSVIAFAASVMPNENKPPWYFDMPYVISDGKATVVPGFVEKMKAQDPRSDIDRYLAQPARLNALLFEEGTNDQLGSLEVPRELDKLLTEKGIAHDYAELPAGHCDFDLYPPMLKFMSDHLVGEETKK